jgi:hypothetical protein
MMRTRYCDPLGDLTTACVASVVMTCAVMDKYKARSLRTGQATDTRLLAALNAADKVWARS